ncbi:MAG: hypothetical protein ACFCGT_04830 [Sandaracinaceae bacterium]
MRAAALTLLALHSLAACGSREPSGDQGFLVGDMRVAPARIPWLAEGAPPIDAPRIPWLGPGREWTCPDGWHAVDENDVTVCEPYPAGGALTCPGGQAHFPGEPGCTAIGEPCGEGPFADLSDVSAETPRLYVLRSGASGGDGSERSPFGRLSEALDTAASGTLIVLGSGAYEVDRPWPDGVSLRGRCVEETSLVAPARTDRAAVIEIGRREGTTRITSVRIGPSPLGAVEIRRPGPPLELVGVEVAEVTGAAIGVTSGGEVIGRSIVVRDTQQGDADGTLGLAYRVEARGRLRLERAVVERYESGGLLIVDDGSIADCIDLVIRDPVGVPGTGIQLGFGAKLELRRAAFERNVMTSLLVNGLGASATVEDAVFRDTRGAGRAVNVQFGGELHLRRALIDQSTEKGVAILDPDSEATLEDVVIRGTQGREADGRDGRGLSVELGARVNVRRALFERNRFTAVNVFHEGTRLELNDVVVRDTRAEVDSPGFGVGLDASQGGELVVRRASILRSRGAGGFFRDAGTRVTIEHAVVRDTRPNTASELGVGLAFHSGARGEVDHLLVEGSSTHGIFLFRGGDLGARDLVVRDTLPDAVNGFDGNGVDVYLDSRLALERALVERSGEYGVLAFGEPGEAVSATLTDVVVRETQGPRCLPVCTDRPAGVGLGVIGRAEVMATRVELADALTCGVQVHGEGQLCFDDAVLRRSPIAVCLSNATLPLAKLQQGASYIGHDVVVDTSERPRPDPDSLAGLLEL